MYQARSQVEVLTRCLQSDDDRIAMMAAQAILDRGYCKLMQSIDANVTEDGGLVCYYGEVPKKAQRTEAWLELLGRGQVFPNWTRPTDDLEGARRR